MNNLGFSRLSPWRFAPVWMRYIQALVEIAEGMVTLFTIPFRYTPTWSGSISSWIIRHGIKVREDMRRRL